MALPIFASDKLAAPVTSSRSSRRRGRSLVWAFIALMLFVFVYFAHEPAASAYRKTDWHKLKPSFFPTHSSRPPFTDASVETPHEGPVEHRPIDSTPVPPQALASEQHGVPHDTTAELPYDPAEVKGDAASPQQADPPSKQHQHLSHTRPDVGKSATLPPTPTGEPIPDTELVDHGNPRGRLPEWMQKLMEWKPPEWAWMHMPFYGGFYDRDYDPSRWEAFPKNTGLFEVNTASNDSESFLYRPYPDYNSHQWKQRWQGHFVSCDGYHGIPYNESDSDRDIVRVYQKKSSHGLGEPLAGSADAVGLDPEVCFDRDSRLGPFGAVNDHDVDLEHLRLGVMQNDCLKRNGNRYKYDHPPELRPKKTIPDIGLGYDHASNSQRPSPAGQPQAQPRTALLIRSWEGYAYEENDIHAIRSLVSELSLQSGGEYQVFLFIMLKDWADISDDDRVNAALFWVPEELRDMTIFWSEDIGQQLYPKLGEWRVDRAQFLGVQWFMATHPEFEYVWNWEMDARLIGHHYEFLERMSDFGRDQPRKYLWERNARFYIPEAHGSWQEYFDDSNRAIEKSPYVHPVWGETYHTKVGPLGPKPPTTMEEDEFSWGVGEEADFISLLPIWDPRLTTWGWKRTVHGYNDNPWDMPKRAYINTHARYSRRLLHAMHLENLEGRLMHAEMWPTSVALYHGLKTVYAPHPIWALHEWPAEYADSVFNADGWGAGSFKNASEPDDDAPNEDHAHASWGRGRAYNETLARMRLPQAGTGPNGEGARARWTQERDSIYNVEREHNFFGWSWYYRSDGASLIYWRWLGWKQTYSIYTMGWQDGYDEFPDIGTSKWENEHGRLCMPSMMLHPVKGVKKRPEELEEEARVKEELAKTEAEGVIEVGGPAKHD